MVIAKPTTEVDTYANVLKEFAIGIAFSLE